MSEKQTERFEHLAAAVDAIGRLMGTYEPDSPAQQELEKYRRLVLGVVFGERAGVDLTSESNREFNEVLNIMAGERLRRAQNRMELDDAAAGLLAESALLRKLLGK